MPVLIFSALGVGWIVLLDKQLLKNPVSKILIAQGIITPIFVSFIALDQSRVTAVLLFAPILVFATHAGQLFSEADLRRVWNRYWLVAVIVPVPLFLGGLIDMTGWQSILSWRASF